MAVGRGFVFVTAHHGFFFWRISTKGYESEFRMSFFLYNRYVRCGKGNLQVNLN